MPTFIKGGEVMALEVKVRNNNVEKAMRQLKKKVMKAAEKHNK